MAVYSFSARSVVMRGRESLQSDFSVSASTYLVSLCSFLFIILISSVHKARAFICYTFSLLAFHISLSLPVLKIEQIASCLTLTLSPQICLFINFITVYSYNLEKFPFLTVFVYGSMYLALNV